MSTSVLLNSLVSLVSLASLLARAANEANLRLAVAVILGIVGVISAWLLARRSHTREDRAQVLTTLLAVRRYQAPCGYEDLEDALCAATGALVPFRALDGHAQLLTELTMRGWRDSREHWELNDRDPDLLAESFRRSLSKALEELTAAISLRVRRSSWHQRWGARREVTRIKAAAGPVEDLMSADPPADTGDRVISPEAVLATLASLRRAQRHHG